MPARRFVNIYFRPAIFRRWRGTLALKHHSFVCSAVAYIHATSCLPSSEDACACRKEFCPIRHSFGVHVRLSRNNSVPHLQYIRCVPDVLYFPVRFRRKLNMNLCRPNSSTMMSPASCTACMRNA